jgi:hypothetical protein
MHDEPGRRADRKHNAQHDEKMLLLAPTPHLPMR